jgi:hypothetical protein
MPVSFSNTVFALDMSDFQAWSANTIRTEREIAAISKYLKMLMLVLMCQVFLRRYLLAPSENWSSVPIENLPGGLAVGAAYYTNVDKSIPETLSIGLCVVV